MSAWPDGGQTVYSIHGHVDATYDGEVCYVFEHKTTAMGTKWNDQDEIKWYSLELRAPPKEVPVQVFHHVVPRWEREWVERVRVSEQRSVRDTRQAVWACRPRHGLGGG